MGISDNVANSFLDNVYFGTSTNMSQLPDESVHLIVTSPPYFNIKDYSKNGYQTEKHSDSLPNDIGACDSFSEYISAMLSVWTECERVLKPNGKLCINVPLMPMFKKDLNTHYNRHIFDLQSSIQQSILQHTHLFLYDLYIWNRVNSSKHLMFGSYPYPRNFYAQNTTEFITVYVKDGIPTRPNARDRENSRLTEHEWTTFTKQIWDIPVPNKSDIAYGKHSAIMPEEIPYRCIRLFSYENDVVLDPFTGSGTTLKVAKELHRHYVGYELYDNYRSLIEAKLKTVEYEKQSDLFGGRF